MKHYRGFLWTPLSVKLPFIIWGMLKYQLLKVIISNILKFLDTILMLWGKALFLSCSPQLLVPAGWKGFELILSWWLLNSWMLSYELNCPFNDKNFFNFFIFSIAYCTQNIYLSLLLVHGGLNFFLALTSKLVEGFFPSLVNTDAHIHTLPKVPHHTTTGYWSLFVCGEGDA